MARIAYSRGERKDQVQLAIRIAMSKGLGNGRTMYQIAKSLDMRPSSHLMGILKEMWFEGILTFQFHEHRPGVKKSVWSLTKDYMYPEKRSINLNVRGRKVDQLELEF